MEPLGASREKIVADINRKTVAQQKATMATVEAATPHGVTGLTFMSVALSTFVPVNGASLLVLRYYLGRKEQ